ncbi:MAG: hypothetical protein U0168_02125 [Nannocystaceae bacterium]
MQTPSLRCLCSIALMLAACGKDNGPGGSGDDSSGSGDSSGGSAETTATTTMSTTTVSTTMADSSTGDDASGSSTDGSGSTTGTPASCGDGVVDEGEACDDANRVQGDGCNNDCVESGTIRWELLFDAPAGGSDCGHDIAANAAGTIAVSGEASTADQESYDILVLSIAPDGSVTWSDVYDSISNMESGGGSTDRAYGVAIEDDDEIIVAGHEFLDNVDAENVWIRKYDTTGGTAWTRTGPDTDTGRGYGVSVSDTGDVFVVGTHGLYAFVSKYNTNGVEYWTEERKAPTVATAVTASGARGRSTTAA